MSHCFYIMKVLKGDKTMFEKLFSVFFDKVVVKEKAKKPLTIITSPRQISCQIEQQKNKEEITTSLSKYFQKVDGLLSKNATYLNNRRERLQYPDFYLK